MSYFIECLLFKYSQKNSLPVIIHLMVLFDGLVVVSQNPAVAPFIYTLF